MSAEVQSAFDRKDSKTMYSLLRKVFGPQSSNVAPLKSKDGTSLIKDPAGITQRWHVHFSDFFFNPSVVNDAAIDSLPQHDINHLMDLTPTIDEVRLSLKQLNSGKAPGLDGIPTELLQHGGENILSAIHNMITLFWEGTPIPQDWVDGILVSIFKGKGTKSECDYYSGITLLGGSWQSVSQAVVEQVDGLCLP